MKVVALAGGVGGAKLVDGLAKNLDGDALTVVVNTGDDFDHFGLRICPDLDTVCYTLAGLANPETGWGRAEESWNALDNIAQLGGPTWFQLGDRDLGIHLERTRLLANGRTLSEICTHFCSTWGIDHQILPMSNNKVSTLVHSSDGILPFQDYFVKRKCEPEVRGFEFQGAGSAEPAPGVVDSLLAADLVIICPSNPWVSIDPIFAIPGIREAIQERDNKKPVIAVSPIIQGGTIKGPAAKMFNEMGIQPSAASVAVHYGSQGQSGILGGFVFDILDADEQEIISQSGLPTLMTNTIMKIGEDRVRLANEVIGFGRSLLGY